MRQLEAFLDLFLTIDIGAEDIIDRYAVIDAYSQGKFGNIPVGFTAKNMGKNDIWIAATASAVEIKLITMDKDFVHLDNVYLDLVLIER